MYEAVKISEIYDDASCIKSFRFKSGTIKLAKPGQFFMVLIPESGEIPLSPSFIGEDEGEFMVKNVGKTTQAMHELKNGDKIGIRGPYGSGFSSPSSNPIFIAGGVGIAPLLPMLKEDSNILLGAKTERELPLNALSRFHIKNSRLSTDDGTIGVKGYISDLLAEELTGGLKASMQKTDFIPYTTTRKPEIYACGNELMLICVLNICKEHEIDGEFSIERFMKCGIGVCGSCAIDGVRVCKEGPVLSVQKLRKIREFGRFTRNKCGSRVYFQR